MKKFVPKIVSCNVLRSLSAFKESFLIEEFSNLGATIEDHVHETALPGCHERQHCLKITFSGQTFYLASKDDHTVPNVWFPRIKEIAGCAELPSDVRLSLVVTYNLPISLFHSVHTSPAWVNFPV